MLNIKGDITVKQDKTSSYYKYQTLNCTLRKPDFLVIGGIKCGSTSLFHLLGQHPKIVPPYPYEFLYKKTPGKELNYFSIPDDMKENYQRGFHWYYRQFPPREDDNLAFEASPVYLYFPHVPKRIYDSMPFVKLIVILRNPVDRAWSNYKHWNAEIQNDRLPFKYAIKYEEKRIEGLREKYLTDPQFHSRKYINYSYLERGRWYKHLKAFYDVFPKENILWLHFEKFFSNPETTQKELNRVCDFLGIDYHEFKDLGAVHQSTKDPDHLWQKNKKGDLDPAVREMARKMIEPDNQKLYEFLDYDFGWI